MGTANFRGMGDFGVWAWAPVFDKEWWAQEYPEMSEEEAYQAWLKDIQYEYEWTTDFENLIDEFNDKLIFHKLALKSGYYEGVEIVLDEEPYSEDPKELAEIMDEKLIQASYWDLPNAEKRKFQRHAKQAYFDECNKIEDWLNDTATGYGFRKYGITARFFNGETWYHESPKAAVDDPVNPNEYFFSQSKKFKGRFKLRQLFRKRSLKTASKDIKPSDLDMEVWEGWTVADFIKEQQYEMDMIMQGQSIQKPFRNKKEMQKYLNDSRPNYKKNIPAETEYFANRYGLR